MPVQLRRLLMSSGSFKDLGDGSARSLHRLSQTLDEKGIEHFVFAPALDDLSRSTLHVRQVPSVAFPLYRDYRVSLPGPGIIRQFDQANCQMVQISTPDLLGLWALAYARRRRLPVAGVYHTHFFSYLPYFGVLRHLEPVCWSYLRWFYSHCELLLAPNQAMREVLTRRGVTGRKGIHLWPRGVDSQLFGPHRRDDRLRREWGVGERKCLVFLGRLVWYKGLAIFREVYRLLFPRCHFLLIGEGPAGQELRATMPGATFLGHCSGEKLACSLASGDLLLFPSLTEAFGNAVLEALASGLPAVVADAGGPGEMVKKSGGGRAVKGSDAQAFVQAALELMEDPQAYQRCRQTGLDYASKQTWPEVNGELLRVYDGLLEAAAGRVPGRW